MKNIRVEKKTEMKHSTTRRMNEQRSKKQWNFGSTIQSEEKNRLCEWRKWNSTKNIKANDISNISDEKKFNQFSTVLRCAALQRPVYYMKCIFNSVSWSMDFLCGAFFCFCSYPLALRSNFFTALEFYSSSADQNAQRGTFISLFGLRQIF